MTRSMHPTAPQKKKNHPYSSWASESHQDSCREEKGIIPDTLPLPDLYNTPDWVLLQAAWYTLNPHATLLILVLYMHIMVEYGGRVCTVCDSFQQCKRAWRGQRNPAKASLGYRWGIHLVLVYPQLIYCWLGNKISSFKKLLWENLIKFALQIV